MCYDLFATAAAMAQSHQTIGIFNSIIILLPITVDRACLEERLEEVTVVPPDMMLEQSHGVCRSGGRAGG